MTRVKQCYCRNCKRWFHSLGIARHRAAHRDRRDGIVEIEFHKRGVVETYDYTPRPAHEKA